MPTRKAISPAGMLRGYFTAPNQLTIMMARQTSPMIEVMKISVAGRIAMNAIDTPASVPSSAARGVVRRISGATNPPPIRMKPCRNTQAGPASHASPGLPSPRGSAA
jgi:hypothetical protein